MTGRAYPGARGVPEDRHIRPHVHDYYANGTMCRICGLNKPEEEVTTDSYSRQRAEEALMEGHRLCHLQGCHCDDCHEVAAQMVDEAIEAWRGR